jgi:hypothetical protein
LSNVDISKKGKEISKLEVIEIINHIKKVELDFDGLMGFDMAMATGGGVDLREIDSKTMKSKIIDNLFFAGEVIDLVGISGGYNLQMCWSTGYIAGNSVGNLD